MHFSSQLNALKRALSTYVLADLHILLWPIRRLTSVATTETMKSDRTGTEFMLKYLVTVLQIALSIAGIANLTVIFTVLSRRGTRSATNTYVLSLCLANFFYILNLTLVVATQLNESSWPFGSLICRLYYGCETTGKL